MRGGEMTLLPAVRLFGQLSVGVINMHRNLRPLDLASHPEPVVVAFEKLLSYRLFFPPPQIAAPIILAHLIAFLDVRFRRLQGERVRIVDRSARGRDLQREYHHKENGDVSSGGKRRAHRGQLLSASHDALVEARRNLLDLFDRSCRNRRVHIDQRLDFDEGTLDLAEQRDVELRHICELALKILEQVWLMEQLRAISREMTIYHRSQNLRAAQPSAETNELRKFFIAHFIHRLLDAVLCAIEFLPNGPPIAPVGRSRDRFGMRPDRISNANTSRQSNRSEEHTSELQSRSDLVCRLLL